MNEEDSLPPVLDVPTCDITAQYREGKGFYIHTFRSFWCRTGRFY